MDVQLILVREGERVDLRRVGGSLERRRLAGTGLWSDKHVESMHRRDLNIRRVMQAKLTY